MPEYAMPGFTKLFSSILQSTIWAESNEVRILWITMLAMADKDGIVHSSVPGLARMAGIEVEQAEEGLRRFFEPDKYSRTKDNEGRRIEEVDGGWRLLNHPKYRALMSAEERKEYNRKKQAERRKKCKDSGETSMTVNDNGDKSAMSAHSEAEAESKAERETVRTDPLSRTRPTLEQAKNAAVTAGVSPKEAEEWWHAREGSDWHKGTMGGGSMPVGTKWQSDMITFTNSIRERRAADKAKSAPKKSNRPTDCLR